jgi:hypothetical protein
MRRIPTMVAIVGLFTLLLSTPPTSHAADEVVGEILDMACYIGRGARGPSHKRCAQKCAEHNMPLGVLTDDGTVYLLYPKHGAEDDFETVKQLAGTKAKITGKSHDKDGLKGFEVHGAVAAE